MVALKRLRPEDLDNTIHQLAERDHIRHRPEMVMGSRNPHSQLTLTLIEEDSDFINLNESKGLILREQTWIPALNVLLREINDNALDEFSHGFGDTLTIKYNEQEFDFTIRDNGRGIPIDKALLALTKPMTGRNFGIRKEVVGTNGYGAAIVSNTAEKFRFKIWTNSKIYEQTINEGDPEIGGEMDIMAPIISVNQSKKTGTEIYFKPSSFVFKQKILPTSFVRTRVFEIAACNPQYKIYFNDELLEVKPAIEQSLFPSRQTIKVEITDETLNYRGRFWLVPKFVESGDHYHGVVNNIFTPNGGTHVDAFKRIFPSNLLVALEKESKRRRLSPNRNDVTEGLLVYNITNMERPDFDSQSKSRLINEEINTCIKNFLENEEFYKQFIKDNKEWINEIYQRCADRTQKKDASELTKLSRKLLRNKVPGLMDATGSRRQDCTLFLAEGQSAIAGMASVRDANIHGGLGLRGKIMNVNGENPKKVFDNKCLTEIMNSVGLVIGQKAQRHSLRYGKVYIATDMDEDGKNIAALLVNFFFEYWPELFNPEQPPFIFVFQTPFVIAEKGKVRKYWYAHNYNSFDPQDYTGWTITRAKGLGTLMEEDWTHSLKNPVAIPLLDDGKLKEALDLIFNGSRSNDRKTWIGL